jgi:hypothetical protein
LRRFLRIDHGNGKQEAKGALVQEVVKWAIEEPDRAEAEFKKSAAEVISFLSQVNDKLT